MLDYARSDSHFLIPLYGIFQQLLLGNINNVWLREDTIQEEWSLYLKNIANKKKGGQNAQNVEFLSHLAHNTNEFSIDKVLKTNNRRVNVFVKN